MRAFRELPGWIVGLGGVLITAGLLFTFSSVASLASSADAKGTENASEIRVLKTEATNEREWRQRLERKVDRMERKIDAVLYANGLASKDLDADVEVR